MSGIILDPAQGKYICSVIAIVFFLLYHLINQYFFYIQSFYVYCPSLAFLIFY